MREKRAKQTQGDLEIDDHHTVEDTAAQYGLAFTAMTQQRNFYGVQFHPERSGVEEVVEVAFAAISKDGPELCGEIADLLLHVLVLLRAKKMNISNVIGVSPKRNA